MPIQSIDEGCSGFVNTGEKFSQLNGQRGLQSKGFTCEWVRELETSCMQEIAIELPACVCCDKFTVRPVKSAKTGHTTRVFVVFDIFTESVPICVSIEE